MNIFNIGSMEIIWVLAIALIILGPSRLVQFSKDLSKLLKSSRRWIIELQNSFDMNYNDEEKND
jgi:Sec-independent protein translocase protein TatA|tara:strand:- start:208 stop:399 length:192 start_codon:yes stop_codon:yes gene_type:complete